MLDMQSEINRLSSYNNSISKDEKMIRQMLKANEVRIRSLEKENQQMKIKIKKLSEKNLNIEKGLFRMVCDFKLKGGERQDIIDLVEGIEDMLDLRDIFEYEFSMNTEEELKIKVKDSKEQLDSIDGEEGESEDLNEKGVTTNKTTEKESLNPNSGLKNLTVNKLKKPGLSPLQKEKEKSQFQIKLEEEIEKNIQNRSRLKRGSICKEKVMIPNKQIKESIEPKSTLSGNENDSYDYKDIKESRKEEFYSKCKVLDPEIFKEEDRERLELRIKSMKTFESFSLWLWNYFEERVKLLLAKLKKLEYEKSRSIKKSIFSLCSPVISRFD